MLSGDWNMCFREEEVLKMITEYNLKYASSGQKLRIRVPALVSNVNGVEIDCAQHHAFLMEFIDGVESNQREYPFTSYHAAEMYKKLKFRGITLKIQL